MLLKLVVPYFDRSTQQGTITKWYKAEGDRVNYGDELFDISVQEITFLKRSSSAKSILDKATDLKDTYSSNRWDWSLRVISSDMGVLRRIDAKEGSRWEIGHPLAVLTTDEHEPIDQTGGASEAVSTFRVAVNPIHSE